MNLVLALVLVLLCLVAVAYLRRDHEQTLLDDAYRLAKERFRSTKKRVSRSELAAKARAVKAIKEADREAMEEVRRGDDGTLSDTLRDLGAGEPGRNSGPTDAG